ncbi:MAG: hypothetical protein JWQ01_4862 [Massilia sp.]|nr:hypothetical protein [Massilia sp.]
MTTFQLSLVVLLIAAVIISLCLAMYRAADRAITALSADASLDPEPYQPRASTLHEPSSAELLLCAAVVVFVIAAVWLLCHVFADEMVRWMAGQVGAMHRY